MSKRQTKAPEHAQSALSAGRVRRSPDAVVQDLQSTLLARREQLLSHLPGGLPQVSGSGDLMDQVAEDVMVEGEVSMQESTEAQLAQVNDLLRRLKSETIDQVRSCVECGSRIPLERQKLVAADKCVKCQTDAERPQGRPKADAPSFSWSEWGGIEDDIDPEQVIADAESGQLE